MKNTIALLALLSAFPPLSTDMYLAAIPLLVETWHQPLTRVNLTLICFFITYCGFLLIYGPLSDRYGRRPPLLIGLSIYCTASLFCALADDLATIIAARTLQGAGSAAASAIALAICKDRFDGYLRQRVFLQIGIIVAAAPMIAPIIGGWVIEVLSWRWIFVLQATMGTLALIGCLLMEESMTQPGSAPLTKVFHCYIRLVKNIRYILLTFVFAAMGVPFFAFIAASSDIYITGLGYTEREYGDFFAVNSAAFLCAPMAYSRMARHFSVLRLLPVSYFGVMAASWFMLVEWLPLPYRIAVPMWFLTFFFSFGRPPGNNLILEQVDTDAGAASSLMVFVFFMTGACAMWAISHEWHDKVSVLGWFGVAASTFTLLCWFLINRLIELKLPQSAD